MPTAYNPEEIARAKHLVALAEQINAKLDRRLPRFVSFSYTDIVGNDLLLDINANSWTIKFSALSASFRIISVHEDGAPTITFSNGVTSSNIVANGSTFTTTITLPSANVTSFTMTVSFPQTATFSAWSKTYNVDTESAESTGSTGSTTARSIDIQATQYVAEQQKNALGAVNNDATEVNILFPLTGNVITFRFNDTDVDEIPSFSSIVVNGDGMSVVNKSQTHYASTHNMEVLRNTWETSLSISGATVGSITVTLEIPASDTYAAYSRTLTFNLVDSI